MNTQKLLLEFNFKTLNDEITEIFNKNGIIYKNKIFKKEKKSFPSKPKNIVFEEEILDNVLEEEDNEDNYLYYHSSEYEFIDIVLNTEYNLFNNLQNDLNLIKGKIDIKIIDFKNGQFSKFKAKILKKNAKIEEVIEVILNENNENIFDEATNFVRVLNTDIDNIIKSDICIKLEEKYLTEKENINSIIDSLKMIQLQLNDFEKLKILKHTNLDEYINQKIITDKYNFSKYIFYISELERKNFSLFNIDSLGNEIVAEICFLLLNKIFIKEINDLQTMVNDYEKEMTINIVYEELAIKLKKIRQVFENYFKGTPFDLTEIIEDNLEMLEKNNSLTVDRIKNILIHLFKKNIDLTTNRKLSIDEKLFYFKNERNN